MIYLLNKEFIAVLALEHRYGLNLTRYIMMLLKMVIESSTDLLFKLSLHMFDGSPWGALKFEILNQEVGDNKTIVIGKLTHFCTSFPFLPYKTEQKPLTHIST